MSRCLILGCSRTKINNPEEIPALNRYDGPTFKVVRRFLADKSHDDKDIDIYILSAAFGLIHSSTPISDYDLKMTPDIAYTLQPKVLSMFEIISKSKYSEIFILLSKDYLIALKNCVSILPSTTQVRYSQTTEGKRLSELKNWLYQKEMMGKRNSLPTIVKGFSTLKGITIEMSPLKISEIALNSLKESRGEPFNFRDWYCIVGDRISVSPKWLVSQLTGIKVSEFQASDARRVLAQLGIQVYRKP